MIGGYIPYPFNSGGRLRILHLALRLARRHRITLLCLREDDRRMAGEASVFFKDHGIELIEVARAFPGKLGPMFRDRLDSRIMASIPSPVRFQDNPHLRHALAACAADSPVDLWQAEWSPFVKSLEGLPGARKLLMAHNVDSLIWERYHKTERNRFRRWYIGRHLQKIERFERWAFEACDRIVTVTDADASLVRNRFGVPRVDVVDNGIDRSYFEAVRPEGDPNRILFLGSLNWQPNLDAIEWLLDRIFPAVVASAPSGRLSIVGSNPPEALVRKVATLPNVELHADVADVRPYLARCGLMVVPLRIGGGSRIKILEALACGVPVVSTRVGAEGLRIRAQSEFVEADGVEAMTAALVECLRNPGPARAMAQRGRRLVLDQYDWDRLADQLERSWERAVRAESSVSESEGRA